MNKVNMLRLLEIYVGETGNFKKLVVVQEIYRNNPRKMKGCELSFLHNVKRFESWIRLLKDNGFVEPDFFEAKTIMIRNSFNGYTSEAPELKEYNIKKLEKRDKDSHFPVKETIVIDLTGYVCLEFKFRKITNDKRIGDKVFIPLKLDEERKPDSNDFCKLLTLEAYQEGAFELPELPKRAEMFECYVRLELCPDAKNDSGATITEYEFEKARKGELEGKII